MKTSIKNTVALLIGTFLMSMIACTSPAKMIEAGNYDDAIRVSVNKLKGKKNKDPKWVASLETAFDRATKQDVRRMTALEADGAAENWTKIYEVHQGIKRRQALVAPLLPLVDKDGYQADFAFVKVEQLEQESKEKAASYHYEKALTLLDAARLGNQQAARNAYEELRKTEVYFREYREKNRFLEEAHDLGTVHVLFAVKNASGSILPSGMERELMEIGTQELDDFWSKYYLDKRNRSTFDYEVRMNLLNIDLSPEIYREREYVDHKEIQDGWNYVLDNSGNVLKDTLGNDIKTPRFIFIKAVVKEVYQHKVASLGGRLEFRNGKTGELVYHKNLGVDAVFENFAATYFGDRRALSNESLRCIGNSPQPFPSDSHLLYQAARNLQPAMRRAMNDGTALRPRA